MPQCAICGKFFKRGDSLFDNKLCSSHDDSKGQFYYPANDVVREITATGKIERIPNFTIKTGGRPRYHKGTDGELNLDLVANVCNGEKCQDFRRKHLMISKKQKQEMMIRKSRNKNDQKAKIDIVSKKLAEIAKRQQKQ